MPIAQTRLEVLQVMKLLQCVREKNTAQIEKLVANGVPFLVNYNEQNSGEFALGIAATDGDEELIRFLLTQGVHPDVVDFEGRSALMLACHYGNDKCVEILLKAGADFRQTDAKGRNVLFYCMENTQRHAKCAEILMQYNVEANTAAKDGMTPLLTACRNAKDSEAYCLSLLEKGGDANSQNTVTGQTALMYASQSGNLRVVRELLERGADPNVLDKKQRCAAHYAAEEGHFAVLVCLSAYSANFDQVDVTGNTPMHLAAKAHAMCCKFLGQRGCNPKTKNNEGSMAKQIAKDAGKKDCFKECRRVEGQFAKLEAAKIAGVGMAPNEPWMIRLYDFVYVRQDQFLECFQKADADGKGCISRDQFLECLKSLNAPLVPEPDEQPAMSFLNSMHDKMHDQSVDYKDFISGKKYIGKLYLMAAFEGKKKKKKKRKGGRAGRKKKPPFEVCVMPDEYLERTEDGGPPRPFVPKMVQLTDNGRFDRDKLPAHPLQDDSFWYLKQEEPEYLNINDAAKFGDIESLKYAIKKGYNLETRDKYYKTPLMSACSVGNLDAAKLLIENGANVNVRDNFYWTPLHHACHSGQIEIVELLIKNGALLEAKALNGATPLMRAIEASRPFVVDYLIQKGAKVQIENRAGQNPVDVAQSYADPRVYEIVKAKWDSLPPPDDKKKKGGSRKASPKRGKSAGSAKAPTPTPFFNTSPLKTVIDSSENRRSSLLLTAAMLTNQVDDREDVTFRPKVVWQPERNTVQMLETKKERRSRLTWESDFTDFKMPFQKNLADKVGKIKDDED